MGLLAWSRLCASRIAAEVHDAGLRSRDRRKRPPKTPGIRLRRELRGDPHRPGDVLEPRAAGRTPAIQVPLRAAVHN